MSEPATPAISPLTDYLYSKASQLSLPLSGTFELTPACNFSCKMCYIRKSSYEIQNSSRPIMTMERWLTLAEEACKQGMLYLLLTGGEPTLWPGFWELYEKLSAMGLVLSINTNGSLLDSKAIEHLAKNAPRRVNITLYGSSDKTYEKLCGVKGMYAQVIRNIDSLKEAGILIKLNCSLTPYNAEDLKSMIQFAQERELILDITSYMFPPLRRDASMIGKNDRFSPKEAAYYRLEAYRMQHGQERYVEYLKNIVTGTVAPPAPEEACIDPIDGSIRCRAGKACFWVSWDGKLMPCGMMSEPWLELDERNFALQWGELNRLSSELKLSGLCTKCANQQLCHACAAMAQTETGTSSGIPSYLCETAKEMKLLATEALNKLI